MSVSGSTTSSATAGKYLEGMRLSEHERGLLIEQMKKSGVAERRKSPRFIVDGSFTMLLTMDAPGGGNSSCYRIYPWDISRGGVGFFHRSFVYPGTRCTFTGVTLDGQPFTITGDVVRCSHVSGNVHAVGTKLDSEIDPEVIIGPATTGATAGAHPAAEDWWTRLNALASDVAKLARERAAPEVVRARLAKLEAFAKTSPVPAAQSATEA